MSKKIIIGSRGSKLARWQATYVLKQLQKTGQKAKIKIIKTKGDIIQNLSWDKMEGKGFFTKEIEDALLKKEIDIAVHSHKDLPTEQTKGLVIAAVSGRQDPSELLLIHNTSVDETQKFFLKKNAIVGTSSARRKSQLLAWRSDLQLKDLRGNVPTRIQKLRKKKYDAILIAAAGVARLKTDISEFHCEKLSPREFIPAPAQGVLALQIREGDKKLFATLQKINNKKVQKIVSTERKVMSLLKGGCQLPLGVYCEPTPSVPGLLRADNSFSRQKRREVQFALRIALSPQWNSFPRYFYFQSRKLNGLAEQAVKKIKSCARTERAVFISRNEKENDFFKRCLEANGYTVFCQSLIETKPIAVKVFPPADWVFFSSKNAVRHFFEQNPFTNGARFGAISKATADEIRKYGKRVEFMGGNDTKLTAKKFSKVAGNKKVLFPQAKESLRTIQQHLKKEQVIDLPVYETLKKYNKFSISDISIFVFTSPSNIEAFFETHNKNNFPSLWSRKRVGFIAMGNTTANALEKLKVKVIAQPASFDDLGLVQAVMSW